MIKAKAFEATDDIIKCSGKKFHVDLLNASSRILLIVWKAARGSNTLSGRK